MKISLNANRVNQSTLCSTLDTVKNNQASPSTQKKR